MALRKTPSVAGRRKDRPGERELGRSTRARPSATPAGESVFGIEARGGTYLGAGETTAQQPVGRLALPLAIGGDVGAESTADEVAGDLVPVHLHGLQRCRDSFTAERMHAELGTDAHRPVPRGNAAAYEAFGEAVVILPTRRRHLVDSRNRRFLLDAARGELAG